MLKYRRTPICFYLCFVFWLSSYQTKGQEPLPEFNMEQELALAERLIAVFKNDSATIILVRLIGHLEQLGQLQTPLGLKAQLLHAEALEKDHKNETAMQKLLEVVEASQKNRQWDVLTHAYLSLARLYEKIDRQKNCQANLWLAKATINEHSLDSIYPRYAIRISSYHRIFSDRDSSLFYAREVLRTAPKFKQYGEETVGHLLLGMLLSRSSYEEAAFHYKAAGKYWLMVENFNGYAAIMSNLASLHLRNEQATLALSYNDSALIAATKAAAIGNDALSFFYYNYKKRARIYQALGQHDSALYYMEKGYKTELKEVKQSNHAKVIEIDVRYKDEKKARKIVEQDQAIKYEKEKLFWILALLFMSLIFVLIITYYFLLSRKANKALAHSLKKQLILQGEIHHRVKNNLQVIISLLELQMEDVEIPHLRQNFAAMSNRIYSMAAIHEILYEQDDAAHLNFFDYAENLCIHFSNFSLSKNKPIFNLDIGNQYFNLETSMPLGIMLTELLTNSLKYARIDERQLVIHIILEPLENDYCLHYRDNGPGFPDGKLEERKGGLGSYLLRSMVRQLNGRFETKNENGATYKIFFKEKISPENKY